MEDSAADNDYDAGDDSTTDKDDVLNDLDAIQSHGRQRRMAKATSLSFFIQAFPNSLSTQLLAPGPLKIVLHFFQTWKV